jgi:hypothetical protein
VEEARQYSAVTALLTLGVVAMASYFYWVVATALMRGRTPDFGRDIYRSEQPGKYWVQVVLYTWMALGLTIFALFLIGDMTGQ